MIRVDLGKDELERRKSPLARLVSGLVRKRKNKGALPPAVRRTRATSAFKSGFVLTFAAALAFLPQIVFSEYRTFVLEQNRKRKDELTQRLEVLRQDVAKLVPFQRELESYEAQKQLVSGKIDVVRQLLSLRGTPVNVMDAIGQSLPKQVWVEQLVFESSDSRQFVEIKGSASTNELVSDYVDRLSESVHLEGVNLRSVTASSNDRNGADLRAFVIDGRPKVSYPAANKAADETRTK